MERKNEKKYDGKKRKKQKRPIEKRQCFYKIYQLGGKGVKAGSRKRRFLQHMKDKKINSLPVRQAEF